MRTRLRTLALALFATTLFAALWTTSFADQQETSALFEEWRATTADHEAGDLHEIEINGITYRFRWAPPGTFAMGYSEKEREELSGLLKEDLIKYRISLSEESFFDYSEEKIEASVTSAIEKIASDVQQHDVTLSYGFWILETPVTQAMWKSIMGDYPGEFKDSDFPVEGVSWIDCQKFLTRLNKLGVAPSDACFMLPTEAQWEYACRAGTTTSFSWGDSLNGDRANCNGARPYGTEETGEFLGRTTAVGSYEANPWGLFDMHGNVWEWCADSYDAYPSGAVTDPFCVNEKRNRVLRGGSWFDYPEDCRSASRARGDKRACFVSDDNSANKEIIWGNIGFRIVLAPPSEKTQDEDALVQRTATPAEEWTASFAGREAGELRVINVDGVSYSLRWCPPGAFATGLSESEQEEIVRARAEEVFSDAERAGSEWSEEQRDSLLKGLREYVVRQTQRHDVTLTQGFWILETEVTQRMWESIMEFNHSDFKGANLPVEDAPWVDCQKFIVKLNELGAAPAGYCFALPTEAQWEYACRAGTTTAFSWGDTFTGVEANCKGPQASGTEGADEVSERPKPVGSYAPNPWGLYDMHGNVAEWCGDRHGDYPSDAVTDPRGSVSGSGRVCRGGSYRTEAVECRSLSRDYLDFVFGAPSIGFRIVLIPLVEERFQGAGALAQRAATPGEEWTASFAGKEPGDLRVIDVDGVSYSFRWAPPGAFTMGSPESEREEALRPWKEIMVRRLEDASDPSEAESIAKSNNVFLKMREGALAKETQREVTLTQGFWMLETPVTQLMWDSLMGYNPSAREGVNNPVEQVSWFDCQEFVAKLNRLGVAPAGLRFALPTEAQWEYACRAGTTTPFFWGDSLNGDKANCNGAPYGTNERGAYLWGTTPVDRYPANPWGLCDMHGNVWEYCQDWFGDYSTDPVIDPRGPAWGYSRSIRGGCFRQAALYCRSAAREGAYLIDTGWEGLGFRLVLVP
jgi:formylglycine-generating enzyme required for sulfatase activity